MATRLAVATATNSTLDSNDWRHLREFASVLTGFDACSSTEATASLRRVLARRFTAEQRKSWRNPRKGVWRSVRANVPCDDTAQWWVSPTDPNVSWHAQPMHAHCCNKGPAIMRCPGGRIVEPPASHCGRTRALAGKCESDAPLLCAHFLRVRGAQARRHLNRASTPIAPPPVHRPVVYSFGLAEQWTFEDWAGREGFDVFAFDPTEASRAAHAKHAAAGVRFFYMGLGARGGRAGSVRLQGYGALGGEVLALDDLAARVGHDLSARPIRLLKIDCEGCEWEAFVDVAERAPHVLEHVCTLVFELHLTRSLQLNTTADLKRMAAFWRLYVRDAGFRFWFLHANPGAEHDREVPTELRALGLDPSTCCYEVGLRRESERCAQ